MPDPGRKLPYSEEAERCLLGCLLLNGESVSECVERLASKNRDLRGAEFFHDYRHQLIYQALIEMSDRREPIDLATLNVKLTTNNKLPECGGPAYLAEIFNAVPTAANLGFYIDSVRALYLRRRLIESCTELVTKSYDANNDDVRALMDEAEQLVYNVAQEKDSKTAQSSAVVVDHALHEIEELMKSRGRIRGLETGFLQFDKLTNGLRGGHMVVIAARPSMGKTSLAMNIVEHLTIRNPRKLGAAGIFSLEMSSLEVIMRMMSSVSGVSMNALQDGLENPARDAAVMEAAEKIRQAKIWIDDTGGLSILDLRARARRMKLNHGIDLLIVDYLQLLRGESSRKGDNRQVEIAQISGGIKALAKELDVPIIVLSQLNRDVEKRESGRPQLSDLRESGAIEQDADIVGLLARAKDDKKESENLPPVLDVVLYLAKNRSGSQGAVEMQFKRDITRFFPGPTVDADDVPPSVREETA